MMEGNVSGERTNDDDTQSQILDAYLYILLESLNGKSITRITLDDCFHSDKCIMLTKFSEMGLTRRFHSYCSRKKLHYEHISDVIPINNAYSFKIIAHVLYNYPRMLSFYSHANFIHIETTPSTLIQDSFNAVCLNARHYILVHKSPCKVTSISVIPDQPYCLRSPSKALGLQSLNVLPEVNFRLLKVAHKACQSLSCPFEVENNAKKVTIADSWCSLLYYEMNRRVGDIFLASTPIVTIDGFSHPATKNSTRFSLGHLTNIFRPTKVENVRYFIGKGAQLYYIQGEVFLECLSDNAIFVQSLLYNIMCGWHPATVIRIPPGCNLKVFNEDEFIKILKIYEGQGYQKVYSLNPLCSIRISFVKGWGISYSRQTITSTPCWVEMHLNSPLKSLDECLRRLDSSNYRCSSRS